MLKNNALFTYQIFVMRIFFDLIPIIINIKYVTTLTNVSKPSYIFNFVPLICELFIYSVSIKPAHKKTRGIHYRIMRAKITTKEENYAMWSTDDEPEIAKYKKDQKRKVREEREKEK